MRRRPVVFILASIKTICICIVESGEYVEFDLDAKFGVIANTKHALYGLVHAGSGE